MADDIGARAFAAFREQVHDDTVLRMWLQVPLEREAYFEQVVAIGAERGFLFHTDAVRAALREGERAWLTQGVEVAP